MPYKDPIKFAQAKKAWAEANKEKVKEIKKAFRARNKEKITAEYKDWVQANRGKRNASNSKRRAAKMKRTPGWLTKEDLGKIQEFYTVAQKKTRIEGIEYHVDHIIPLQGKNISGLHVLDNLQVIRAVDNLSKHNRYTI